MLSALQSKYSVIIIIIIIIIIITYQTGRWENSWLTSFLVSNWIQFGLGLRQIVKIHFVVILADIMTWCIISGNHHFHNTIFISSEKILTMWHVSLNQTNMFFLHLQPLHYNAVGHTVDFYQMIIASFGEGRIGRFEIEIYGFKHFRFRLLLWAEDNYWVFPLSWSFRGRFGKKWQYSPCWSPPRVQIT